MPNDTAAGIVGPFDGLDVPWLLKMRADMRSSHPFLIWAPFDAPARRWSYGEFHERVGALAAGLAKRGIKPGDTFSYSNSGYDLLGSVIERASGQSYRDFFQSRVFAPLGMKDTFSLSDARASDRRVAPNGDRPANRAQPSGRRAPPEVGNELPGFHAGLVARNC